MLALVGATLLFVTSGCRRASHPAQPDAGAAQLVPLDPKVDWEQVAFVLALTRDEYGEQIEDGNRDGVPGLLEWLDRALVLTRAQATDALGFSAALQHLRDGIADGTLAPRVVAHECIRLLEQVRAGATLLRAPPRPPDLARGEVTYRASCAPCHGLPRERELPARAKLMNPPPASLDSSRPPPEEMFARITYGGAGTAMPAFGDSLEEQERWDVVFYVFAARWPACERKGLPQLSSADLARSSDNELWKRFGFGAAPCLRREFKP